MADGQWVIIQEKTFRNWCNEQLKVSGRSVTNLLTDLCDGVCLVALVEALQFRKVGRVYTQPNNRIQQLQNVSLALTAITDDNVKLVNVGSDDIVNGNSKLILGLVWSLVQKYQISSKTKLPPKKLMTMWFRNILPDLDITNFTSDWSDGIALHALIEHLKPGTSPEWRRLNRSDRVENCRRAMVLAKEQLNIPRVIGPEDFASSALDEMSSMTYLSYFVKLESPGYYHILNWACKQLRTTNITNLTSDWSNGYYLCAIIISLGGNIPGWPNLDKSKQLENCQLAIDAARELGIEPVLSAKEMSDPNIDHLSMMAYLTKFQNIQPKKSKGEKLQLRFKFDDIKAGSMADFQLVKTENDVDTSKCTVKVEGEAGDVPCNVKWENKVANCTFTPAETGNYKLLVTYDGAKIIGCPVEFVVKGDHTKVQLLTKPMTVKMGQITDIQVDISGSGRGEVIIESTSPTGELRYLTSIKDGNIIGATLNPKEVGIWKIHVYFGEEEVRGSPIQIKVYDPQKAWLSGPEEGLVNDVIAFRVHCKAAGEGVVNAHVTCGDVTVSNEITRDPETADVYLIQITPEVKGEYDVKALFNDFEIRAPHHPTNENSDSSTVTWPLVFPTYDKSSPRRVTIQDPSQITVTGEGITRGVRGEDTKFTVNASDVGGNITVEIEVSGKMIESTWNQIKQDVYEFCYRPFSAGVYNITVLWNGHPVKGSPFHPNVTDRTKIILIDDLTDMKDENDHLALMCDSETILNYNISEAGPGTFTAEVLSPDGRLPVNIRHPDTGTVQVGFTAKVEGDHYIHLYWSNIPLERSPILAYCPGPVLPVNHAQVVIRGEGHITARATVPAEFMVDGKKAGPGIPRVRMVGVRADVNVEMRALKYDRYQCKYYAPYPGGYLLYVEWSGFEVPGSPFKVNVSSKGHSNKVKVEGQGLRGGYVGQELRAIIDTTEAGNGVISSECFGTRHSTRCDQIDHQNGRYTLRVFPTEACRHKLVILYDGDEVPGSPFTIPVGEPPDPRKVRVYGPGIEPGVIQRFESKFIVETYGAGAGQLSVRVRGPRSAFKVEMRRDREDERTILCRYDPEEPGEYILYVMWSGVHVPGSPFKVPVFDSMESLYKHVQETKQIELIADYEWKEEI